MTERELTTTARWTALCLVFHVACVSERAEDGQGTVYFSGSGVQNLADYTPAVVAGQPGPPLGAAGVLASPLAPGGSAAPPIGPAGAASPLPMGGRGSGSAGRPAAMGGSAGMASGAAGGGGAGSQASAAGAPAPSTGGMLMIDFTSVGLGGRYAPRNVGAVWIETESGAFVKTLERWAGIRANHLEHWTMLSGGWGSRLGGGGNTVDQMDAVSRATLRAHEAHRLTWDMADAAGKVVPAGKYKLGIEMNDDNRRPGTFTTIEFEKGAEPLLIMAPNKAPYTGLTIRYQP